MRAGNVNQVKQALRADPEVDAPSYSGWTPLMYACATGKLEIAKYLLQFGATASAPESYETTIGAGPGPYGVTYDAKSKFARPHLGRGPLHLASEFGQLELCTLLLDHNDSDSG